MPTILSAFLISTSGGTRERRCSLQDDLSYDGTRYKGWQRLKTSEATIQQKVESVLSRIFLVKT